MSAYLCSPFEGNDSLAQLVEHITFNDRAQGSNP